LVCGKRYLRVIFENGTEVAYATGFLVENRDSFDFNLGTQWKCSNRKRGAGWTDSREVLAIDAIELGKLAHIARQETRCLYDIVKGSPRGFEEGS